MRKDLTPNEHRAKKAEQKRRERAKRVAFGIRVFNPKPKPPAVLVPVDPEAPVSDQIATFQSAGGQIEVLPTNWSKS